MSKQNHSKDSQIHCKGKTIILQLDAARKQLGNLRPKGLSHKRLIHRNRERILLVIVDVAQLFSESEEWMDICNFLKDAGVKIPRSFQLALQDWDEFNDK